MINENCQCWKTEEILLLSYNSNVEYIYSEMEFFITYKLIKIKLIKL